MKTNLYIEFQLIDKCNWNCSYCNYASKFNLNKEIEFDEETILNIDMVSSVIDKIKSFCDIHLLAQGGEIGLLSREKLNFFFKRMKQRDITISTNGEFIKNDYHLIFDEFIGQVHYHVVEDYDQKYQKIFYKENDKIIPGAVITKFDIEFLKDFIQSNEYLKYLDFEFPLNDELSESIYNNVIQCRKFLIDNFPQLYDNCSNNILGFDELLKYQDGCKNCNRIVTIDFVNNKLLLCSVKNRHISIDLNRQNLVKLLTEFRVYNTMNSNCKTCIRNCFSFDKNYITNHIFTKNKLKRILNDS